MAESPRVKQLKGWFVGLGRAGDRTIEQQMTGLQQVVDEVPGKTVLDAGCAEGMISIELARAGAESCLGLEMVPSFVAIGNEQAQELPCRFRVANLNDDDLAAVDAADIVLMLAILHKCKDPTTICTRLAAKARDLCVIRLPPYGMVINDARSGNVPHDIGAAMTAAGFVLEREARGPLDEWLGYFRRPAAASGAAREVSSIDVDVDVDADVDVAGAAVEPGAVETMAVDGETMTPATDDAGAMTAPRRRRAKAVEPITTQDLKTDASE